MRVGSSLYQSRLSGLRQYYKSPSFRLPMKTFFVERLFNSRTFELAIIYEPKHSRQKRFLVEVSDDKQL